MDCISGALEAQVNNPLRSYGDTIRGLGEMCILSIRLKVGLLYVVRRGVKRTVMAEVWDRHMGARGSSWSSWRVGKG